MDLTLTEDQELIKSTAGELLESRSDAAGARAVAEDPAGYSAALWKEVTELGWMGLGVPEAYGGLGSGFMEVCLLIEEMGRHLVPSPFLSTTGCCAPAIAAFGTEEQKREWLGAIARGRVVSPVLGRWDRAGADGVVAATSGEGAVLDGTATFVPYAQAAHAYLVAAGDPSGGERTAYLVDASAPGITVEPLTVIGPGRSYRVTFSGVTVPAGRALAAGAAPAMSAYGASATCAEMVGGAQRVLDISIEYATQREQFGKPIGSFQAVQHHCADMATDVLSSRFIAYEAIWRLSAGLDATAEVSMAKAWVSEAYERVCALGHQVHGAIGFTAEHDLHRYSAHATAAALTFGDGDHHWDRVADHLGLP
ncbi:MAG: acyl-CoA dehydrogenase [Streptosporangiales bacterium]|nr:acyl-CoA dehydrogenase [Streptosporangiales bacterium]